MAAAIRTLFFWWRVVESAPAVPVHWGRRPCGLQVVRFTTQYADGRSRGVVPRARRRHVPTKAEEQACKEAVEVLVRALTAEGAVVVQVLDSKGIHLRTAQWFMVLQVLGERHLWRLSLEVFRWIQVQVWYRNDGGFYSKLISIMGKADKTKLATWLFVEMKHNGLDPDTSAYNAVIAAQVRNSRNPRGWEKGLRFLNDMQGRPSAKPNIVTYNTLIRACGIAGEVDVVSGLFVELRKDGLLPDLYTFNGLLDAYGKAGNIEEMEKVFPLMQAEYLKPDLITYNILIDVYGKNEDLDKMERVFGRMQQIHVAPDLKTFHSMLSCYGKAGLLDKMDALFERMLESRIAPTFVTFEIRIRSYAQAGCLDKMEDCLQEMERAGVKLLPSTFTVMLQTFCEKNCCDRAETLLRDAPGMGLYPDVRYYGSVLKAYGKAGQMQKVNRLLDKMSHARVQPNEDVVLDMFEVYAMSSSRSLKTRKGG